MNLSVVIRAEHIAVAERLHELGVTQETLQIGAEAGRRYASECTKHDPSSLPGVLAWGKTIRSLRDSLVPLGWTINNARNYPTVVHPTGSHAISVAAGDEHTGIADKTPSTRSEKGTATGDAVAQNQMSFDQIDYEFPKVRPLTTWLLLHYADPDSDTVRLELSLPSAMTGDGYVASWRERIILSPLRFASSHRQETSEPTEALNVKVERRAAI